VKDEHVKDAAKDMAQGLAQDVAEDMSGAAEDGNVKLLVLPIVILQSPVVCATRAGGDFGPYFENYDRDSRAPVRFSVAEHLEEGRGPGQEAGQGAVVEGQGPAPRREWVGDVRVHDARRELEPRRGAVRQSRGDALRLEKWARAQLCGGVRRGRRG